LLPGKNSAWCYLTRVHAKIDRLWCFTVLREILGFQIFRAVHVRTAHAGHVVFQFYVRCAYLLLSRFVAQIESQVFRDRNSSVICMMCSKTSTHSGPPNAIPCLLPKTNSVQCNLTCVHAKMGRQRCFTVLRVIPTFEILWSVHVRTERARYAVFSLLVRCA